MRRQKSEIDRRLETETRLPRTAAEAHAAAASDVPALTLLAHPDPRRVGELVTLPELASGEAVALSRLEPLFAAPGSGDVRPLGDPHLSRRPLRLVPGGEPGEIRVERAGSPTPAVVGGEPLADGRLLRAAEITRGTVVELGPHVALLLHLELPLTLQVPRFDLVGDSAALVRLRREIQLAAGLETPVLLRGASGTGKELVARALHDAGRRRDRPWVAVNMAAVPPALAAAELFGARKGAFTGADRSKRGFFAAADGGTLFLDEVGDTPPEVQPLLLRALESGEIQPVGSAETRRVDVRVIAATDVDLAGEAAGGRFRTPLLHRLAGWEIRLPTLAERRSDIGRLLVHFLAQELEQELRQLPKEDLPPLGQRPWASAPLLARLARHDWPGNVRQLRNVARRLAIVHRADPAAPLPAAIESLLADGAAGPRAAPEPAAAPSADPPAPAAAAASPTGRWRPVYRKAAEVSDDELIAALRARRWELKPAAEALGVSRSVLYQLIERCPRVRTAAQLGRKEIEAAVAEHGGDVAAAALDLEVSCQGLKLRMKALGLR